MVKLAPDLNVSCDSEGFDRDLNSFNLTLPFKIPL